MLAGPKRTKCIAKEYLFGIISFFLNILDRRTWILSSIYVQMTQRKSFCLLMRVN